MEINPEYSLEGLMLKLKLQYFGNLMRKTDSLEKPWFWEWLKVGLEGDDRRWISWIASPTRWTWVWVSSRNWWWTGKPGVLQSMGSQRVGQDKSNWAELNWLYSKLSLTDLKVLNMFKENFILILHICVCPCVYIHILYLLNLITLMCRITVVKYKPNQFMLIKL